MRSVRLVPPTRRGKLPREREREREREKKKTETDFASAPSPMFCFFFRPFLFSGMERRTVDVGSQRLWRFEDYADALREDLVARHSPLQQVSIPSGILSCIFVGVGASGCDDDASVSHNLLRRLLTSVER